MCRRQARTTRARTRRLLTWFPDEPACLDYLEWLRWPDGFRCSAVRWACWVAVEQRSLGVCGVRASGVGYCGDDLPPHSDAAAIVVRGGVGDDQPERGVSALGIQRSLGLGSYQTAWAMLHRYRKAMVRPRPRAPCWLSRGRRGLPGRGESGVFGRQTDTKAIVAIAVEIKNPKGFGRIRLQRVDDVSKDSLIPFIESAVEPGATVHTDGWQAYWTVPDHGYEHERTIMRGERRSCPRPDAGRPSRREPAQALAAWHPPRVRRTRASRRLTSTNSRSASTDAALDVAACSSTDCSTKRSSPTPSPTAARRAGMLRAWINIDRMGRPDRRPAVRALTGGAQATAFDLTPDSQLLGAGTADGKLLLLDTRTGREMGAPVPVAAGAVRADGSHPTAHTFAVGSTDATASLWDLPLRQAPRQPVPAIPGGDPGRRIRTERAIADPPCCRTHSNGRPICAPGSASPVAWPGATLRPRNGMTSCRTAPTDRCARLRCGARRRLEAIGGSGSPLVVSMRPAIGFVGRPTIKAVAGHSCRDDRSVRRAGASFKPTGVFASSARDDGRQRGPRLSDPCNGDAHPGWPRPARSAALPVAEQRGRAGGATA